MIEPSPPKPPGATHERGRTHFRVWAPERGRVAIRLLEPERTVALERTERGYHEASVDDAPPGTRYWIEFEDGTRRPDPASRFQPEGVHGPSAVVSSDFAWTDRPWRGVALDALVFYEVHVGTFSAPGTFDGVIPHLEALRELGVTAIELMPVAQFPGRRNWGYDGVLPWAVQDSYGGPDGLRRLVDAAHAAGLAVALDVVYNHLGPEGNHLREFGPYFTSSYATPWGDALNFDGAGSDEVRRYFIDNALHWFEDYHIDVLRLDAVHAILDRSARPFLQQLAEETDALAERLGRPLHLVAESDLNDARLIRPREVGGYGLHAQWSDDFHHAVHAALTGEREGYYADFASLETLADTLKHGWAYRGDFSAHRGRAHGNDPAGIAPERFVVAIQNHDQVGNRMKGERLGALVDFEGLKTAAAALLLSPFTPLLWMGEEYGETRPFPYFVSHGDADLVQAVREGRRREFESFAWAGEPPDPQSEATFQSAKLDHGLRGRGDHARLYALYRELLDLRRRMPELRAPREVWLGEDVLMMVRRGGGTESILLLALGGPDKTEPFDLDAGLDGTWTVAFDSAVGRWGGPGSLVPGQPGHGRELRLNPRQAVLLRRS